MLTTSKGEGSFPHRRAHPRLRLHIPARLILMAGTEQCMLSDVSISGAGVIPQSLKPRTGANGILQCENIAVFGEVVWTGSGRCGVRFEDVLPLDEVIALRHFAETYDAKARAEFLDRARRWVQGSGDSLKY